MHHHLIYQAYVGNNNLNADSKKVLEQFLYNLLKQIEMKCLIPAQLKFSEQKAWTGIMGIITSHIAFHFWTIERYVQLDIYSCKPFDRQKAIKFLNDFWKASNTKVLFIDREVGKRFEVKEL